MRLIARETLPRSSKSREEGYKGSVCTRRISHCFCLMSCKAHPSEWKQIIYYCKERLWQRTALLVADRGVQSAVRSLTRVKCFPVVSNSLSPAVTYMGGSWGQRWLCLPCYQHHGNGSSPDVCAEYGSILDLMRVAQVQKTCPPPCLWTVKVIRLGMWRSHIPPPPVNLCLWSTPLLIRLFDPAPLAMPSASELCCRVHEQLWPIDRGRCVGPTSQCGTISIQFLSELEKKLWK